jgi:hypothetical protein
LKYERHQWLVDGMLEEAGRGLTHHQDAGDDRWSVVGTVSMDFGIAANKTDQIIEHDANDSESSHIGQPDP